MPAQLLLWMRAAADPLCACMLQDKFVIQVAVGRYHTIAVTNKGELYSWGLNDWGQLGRPGQVNRCQSRPLTCRMGATL